MDEDDIPLNQLKLNNTIISNDQMLTPFDPAIEFQFDSSEIFNFDLTDFDLYTFYEKSLNLGPFDNVTDAKIEDAEENKPKDADVEKTDAIQMPDECNEPIISDPVTLDQKEAPSTSEMASNPDPTEANTSNTTPDNKIIQCGYCQFHTISLHDLRAHMREHSNQNGKKYKCYYCNFLTKRSYYLRQHGAYMHGSAYNCKLCVFKTYSNSKMLSHIRHIH